ncbi:STAS domain-containing protein [Streptomyces sp. NPDC018045]|uniref:STAS domain-containing protein n=1 Tax=Streptomyces sp. NPDC018045 TaxID=3365037 RepID=UPI0037B02D37
MNDTFRLTTRRTDGDLALAALAGDLDLTTAPALRAAALDLIGRGHRHLVLDMAAVSFCDSSGFNALVGIWRCAKEADGTLGLAAVSGRLARLLKITGLDVLLPAYPTTAEALAAPRRGDEAATP